MHLFEQTSQRREGGPNSHIYSSPCLEKEKLFDSRQYYPDIQARLLACVTRFKRESAGLPSLPPRPLSCLCIYIHIHI